ncbi:ABC transporter substrate-binding protein [Mobiluncus mulieris]|uniref:ABC transporter substrate binding protein n=2 Tax=Mobiluncus mulieris TaxID=2052 RepID=E0QME3_9ACTO|nr:tryptophan ABC transporter substrate-binding protein [Mobiluncus mulieris]EFM47197.1 ABC transporter substrate binding protein [Mobiluncus mulieris ATCC 35239]MBB5847430.1 putative ABC transport system substrate-binding protein [Mobiluncus mulieris]MCU9971567.1 ABC transporter substrate-binding protein [Mobiluncus mulieris]MCU9976044.1 ABC transporter substrate-binding protein [Mobiluncus mulieris]MCU9997034.1 ABC transporter substrate-binding protein [Mobiluncus mulieris]
MKTKKISLFGAILVGCLLVFVLCLPLLSTMKHSTTAQAAGTTSPDTKNASGKIIQIGLLQLMSHPSLDDIRQGIYDGLANRGYKDGENIKIDYQNGQGDQTLLKTISDQFVADKKDYLVGITTTGAQALANSAQNSIPLIFSAASDPKGSGLVKDNDKPGVNVTGVADHNPVEEQLKFLKQVLPNAKRLGIIYSSSSQNMAELLGEVRTLAPKYDLTLKEATITTTNELAQVAEQLAEDVDVVFAPNDNTIASAMPTLASACNAHKVPVIPAVDRMVAEGGLATVGLNQRQFGLDTANIVADLIEGKKAADYPVVFTNKLETVINSKVATELGIKIPQDIMAKAKDASKE